MSLWTVFVATRMEARPLERAIKKIEPESSAARPGDASTAANRIRWFTTGIGPEAASQCAARVFAPCEANPPSAVPERQMALVAGLCGGISPLFSERTIVAYTECLSHDPGKGPLPCCEALTARFIASLRAKGLACNQATGITVPRIVASVAGKRGVAQQGASVMDMESYPIIQAAQAAGVPVAVLRVVSDAAGQAIPDFNPALGPDGGVKRVTAACIALRSPILTARLLGANRRALHTLSRALEALLLDRAG